MMDLTDLNAASTVTFRRQVVRFFHAQVSRAKRLVAHAQGSGQQEEQLDALKGFAKTAIFKYWIQGDDTAFYCFNKQINHLWRQPCQHVILCKALSRFASRCRVPGCAGRD